MRWTAVVWLWALAAANACSSSQYSNGGVCTALTVCPAFSALDVQFSAAGVFDCSRGGGCGTIGGSCTVSAFGIPMIAPWSHNTHVVWAAGDYLQFTQVSSTDVGLEQYTSTGAQKAIVAAHGIITATGVGSLLYIGEPDVEGGTGYYFTTGVFALSGSNTFTVETLNPAVTALQAMNFDSLHGFYLAGKSPIL